ncbi:hypothetical protein BDI4_840021 [Burkholderia diffusa]|nr:hypothetical protein BDI4_840021 [Burkholderia diffusa]
MKFNFNTISDPLSVSFSVIF